MGLPGSGHAGSQPPARRAAWVLLLFSAGIIIAARAWSIDWTWAVIAAGILGLLALPRGGRWWRAWSSVAVICFGAGWYALRATDLPANSIARIVTERPRLMAFEALILTTPDFSDERRGRLGRFMPASPSSRFDAAALRMFDEFDGATEASGTLQVRIDGDARSFRAGQMVRLTGNARAVPSPSNPGESDRGPWARSRGVAAWLDIDSPGAIVAVASVDQGFTTRLRGAWAASRAAAQERARRWLDADGEAHTADSRRSLALLRALLIGQEDQELQPLRDAFQRLGITHILAISGLNLALLAWAVVSVLRWIGDRPRLEAMIATLVICVYLMVIPAEAPVLRAAVMVLALLIGEAAGRRYDRITMLAWAAIIVLIMHPVDLFNAGFQLSFGVVWALLVLAPVVRSRLFGERPPPDTHGLIRWCFEGFKDAASSSLCAWAIASPVIAYHMGVFSPLGAIATVLLLPLVSVLMVMGYLSLLAATIVPALGPAAVWLLELLAGMLAWAVLKLDAAPWATVYVPSVSLAWTVCATAIIAWWMADWSRVHGWCIAVARRARPPRLAPGEKPRPSPLVQPRWLRVSRIAASLAAAMWLASGFIRDPLPRDVAVRLDTLDVGDGACHLLRVRRGDGGTDAALFDCGSLRLTIGERMIPSAIRALGVRRVATVILSHPNIDHYAGLLDVIGPLGVRRIIVGEAFTRAAEHDGPARFTLEEARRLGVEVRTVAAGDMLGFARILSPPPGARYRQDNDNSLVLEAHPSHDASKPGIVLCGDASREALADLMRSHPDLRARILEAPHHGSYNDVAEAFIDAVAPEVVVQSTGQRRLDETRWDEARAGRDWRITARDGAISTTISRSGGLGVRAWKQKQPRDDGSP